MSLSADLLAYAVATECYTDHHGKHHVFASLPAGETDWCRCGETTAGRMHVDAARRWNDGVRLDIIVAHARTLPGVSVLERPGCNTSGAIVRGVKPDTRAGPDELSWLSEAAVSAGRAQQTRAGVLVFPSSRLAPLSPAVVIVADNPKLVLTDIVRRFFPETEPTWPAVTSGSVVGHRIQTSRGVVLGAGVVIGDDCSIGPNTCLANCVIGNRVTIGANCSIGLPGFGFATKPDGSHVRFPHLGRVVIGDDVEVGSNTCIDRGALGNTVIQRGAKIDNLVHVAHNCRIDEDALVIAGSVLCGGTVVGKGARIAPNATVREQRTVGDRAVVGLGAVVTKDVEPDTTVIGNPARPYHTPLPGVSNGIE